MPYVTYRWLGGMLTNFQTVSKRLSRLKELEEIDFADVAGSGRTKKELLVMKREKIKLEKTLGGIRDMAKVPSAVWIVDTKKEHLAVTEARKLKLPVIAILDTNCDPDEVDYKIQGNDAAEEGAVAADEPMAEWERELLAGSEAPVAETVPAAEAEVALAVLDTESPAPAPEAEVALAVLDTESPAPAPEAEVALAVLDTESPAPAPEAAPVVEAPVVEAPVAEAPVVESPVAEAPAPKTAEDSDVKA